MRIINPTYDNGFKYLTEDNKIARDLVSAIINEPIYALSMQPQEIIHITKGGLRISKIDFKATVRIGSKTGALKTIPIEIQKLKKGLKLVRFREYVSLNYKTKKGRNNSKGEANYTSYPITAIYFLGYRLKSVETPVLKVLRGYFDGLTNKELKVKEDFVEQLSHDMHVIQIPRLKMQVQTNAEKMLDIFNVKKYQTNDPRFLEYTGDTSDPRVARAVKHLNRGTENNEKLLRAMLIEDEIEEALEKETNAKNAALKKTREERAAKEVERAEKERERAEKEAERAEKERERAEKEAERAEKEASMKREEASMKREADERAEKEASMKREADERAEKEQERAAKEASMKREADERAEKEASMKREEALQRQIELLLQQMPKKKPKKGL